MPVNVPITLALSEYDHVRDLLDGTVPVPGVDLTVLRMPVEEIFYRFTFHREWDVSEMSFAKVIALLSQDDPGLVAIPAFVSRVFRHSSIYLRADSPLTSPDQLAGKRIGVPEWAQTASIYSRGMIAHEYGVDLRSIKWVQGGVNEAGRVEKVKLNLPEGLEVTPVRDRSLSQMLLDGDLDAVLTARAPTPFTSGDGRLRRMFDDYPAAEAAYWRKTGIFPIMHTVVIKRDAYERHRWLAMNFLQALEAAKNRSLARVEEMALSYFPVPWMAEHSKLSREMMGPDFWPYGVEANRKTLDAFTTYAHEQGITQRRMMPEELFVPEVRSKFKV
ncbi:ABC transporter substrate-binding protein [Roseomonas sp. BN140053]|uniref:ABC transporter substrate-binding protein n=1 Tax=Roseomonas sp. BN140053 TaxID=3391898 RepID=UPI0039E90F8E